MRGFLRLVLIAVISLLFFKVLFGAIESLAQNPTDLEAPVWAEGSRWRVKTMLESNTCIVHMRFGDRDSISLTAPNGQKPIFIWENQLLPLIADGTEKFLLTADFDNQHQISVEMREAVSGLLGRVPNEFLPLYGSARMLTIHLNNLYFGRYDLWDSQEAIGSLAECDRAMQAQADQLPPAR